MQLSPERASKIGFGITHIFTRTAWANLSQCGDVDEYKITVSRQADINIVLTAMDGTHSAGFSDQSRGYRILRVTGSQGDLISSLQTLTYTNLDYQKHNGATFTGAGEQNWIWDYTYFHPNSLG